MVNASAEPGAVFEHCPRCGGAGLDRQARYGFVCPRCSFLFYLNVAAAVAVIIRDDRDRILLARRAEDPCRGMLDVPGGFVDWGETAEEALRREIREELNLELDDLAYFCSVPNVYEYRGLNYRTLDAYFTARARDWSTLRPADDVDGYALVLPADVGQAEIGFESVRRALARLARTRSEGG
jgi:NAD+ diphosphatase